MRLTFPVLFASPLRFGMYNCTFFFATCKIEHKRGCVIGNTEMDKRGDSLVFEIDRRNFQQMHDLGNHWKYKLYNTFDQEPF